MDANQISLSEAMTLNLGNYQSYRVDVGITLKVKSAEQMEDVYRAAQKFVHENLSRRLDEVCREMKLEPVSILRTKPSAARAVKRVNAFEHARKQIKKEKRHGVKRK